MKKDSSDNKRGENITDYRDLVTTFEGFNHID